jgi:hypothetical protein
MCILHIYWTEQVGQYASAWLEAYEGKDDSLQQWKDVRDMCKHPVYATHRTCLVDCAIRAAT